MNQVPSIKLLQLQERVARRRRFSLILISLGIGSLFLSDFHPIFWGLGATACITGVIVYDPTSQNLLDIELDRVEHQEFGDHPDPNVRALIRKEIDLKEYARRTGIQRDT